MRFRSVVGCSSLVIVFFAVTSLVPLFAQDRVPEGPLKERFFEGLTRPQIVSLMKTLESGEQRTDFELGARYRWGYIPPDRRPPVSLARWWRSLSQRERNEERVKWFHDHYDQIDVDRAARELGQTERLLKIQRDLQQNYGKSPGNLEPVFSSGDTVAPPQSEKENQPDYQGSYQQSTEEPDQPGEMVSVSESESTNTNPDRQTPQKESDRSVETEDRVESDTTFGQTSTAGNSDVESSPRSGENSETGVRYRRVGNEIRVVEDSSSTPSADSDTVELGPDREPRSSDDSSTGEEPGSPNLNLNNSGRSSSSSFLPQPGLRSTGSRPPLRVPED